MPHADKPKTIAQTSKITFRVSPMEKALVEQAAGREGLQVASFIKMILVRIGILPSSSVEKVKRQAVPLFAALHGLLGVVNKIGGNCKQLAAAMPDIDGLNHTHNRLILAAAVITEKLQGHKVPDGVNLYRLQENITRAGHRFNQIVKSVNMGQPNLAGLSDVLAAIRHGANNITAALTGQPQGKSTVLAEADILEKAMEEMRANMRKSGNTDI